jgi:hypothetical protein
MQVAQSWGVWGCNLERSQACISLNCLTAAQRQYHCNLRIGLIDFDAEYARLAKGPACDQSKVEATAAAGPDGTICRRRSCMHGRSLVPFSYIESFDDSGCNFCAKTSTAAEHSIRASCIRVSSNVAVPKQPLAY